MRTLCLLVAASGILAAQPAIVRGTLLERDAQNAGGEFAVRTADNQVYRFQFDGKTYVEREQQLIDVPRLQPGEKVEVVSDSVAGSLIRYARTIHVLGETPRPQLTASRLRSFRATPPTGNLTYSGFIVRLSPERIVIRTRSGEESLRVRKDTQYLQNAELVGSDLLKPNLRVFVRAGKDLYGEVEAYQVMWGQIVDGK